MIDEGNALRSKRRPRAIPDRGVLLFRTYSMSRAGSARHWNDGTERVADLARG